MPKAKKVVALDIPAVDPNKPVLTVELLRTEAGLFAKAEFVHQEPSIFGSTDGKALGTYLEQKFSKRLAGKYSTPAGNSASGIDLPGLNVDIKTTLITQPQSSCPFSSARQKIYGLGYSLLVFVYEKTDHADTNTATIDIKHTIFVEKDRTSDYSLTKRIREIVADGDSSDGEKVTDLLALFEDRNLPIDSVEAQRLATDVIAKCPEQGYLTISNALQWRLQYQRVINEAASGVVTGICRAE
jgi:hypothetical protein